MREELSRLLAGELDSGAEAALRARIATDPALADAWARMEALPDLLAALPVEAPPPALMARLYAMVPEDRPRAVDAGLDAALAALAARADLGVDPVRDLEDAPELGLDAAPFAPDPREDTIDPEPVAPRRLGAPVRLAATRPAPRAERSVAAGPVPATRRFGRASLGVALAFALAVGVGVGAGVALDTPDAPPSLALTSGESVVEGDVHVRAGDLDVRVDGRARITVEPAVERSYAAAAGPDLVVVGTAPRTVAPRAGRSLRGDVGPDVVASAATAGGEAAEASEAERTILVGGPAGRGGASAGRVIVTVESGDVTVAGTEGPVRIAAGETRSFGEPSIPAVQPSLPGRDGEPAASDPRPEPPDVRVDQALARRDLTIGGASHPLTRVVTTLATEPTEWPSEIADGWHPDEVIDRLWSVEDAVPGVLVADLDCDEYPCTAAYASTNAGAGWIRDLRVALEEQFPHREAFVEVRPGAEGELVVVAVGPVDTPASRLRLEQRLRALARDLHSEL